jgi:isopentenyldiphosphate isomerase
MEILDIFDVQMKHIGTAERNEVHTKGYWHKTFHCWIVRSENEKGNVIFQIRDKAKDDEPNKLDITAAGHLEAGETPEDGLRELREELGVTINYDKLHFLGIRINASESGNKVNNEFSHVYMFRDDRKLEEYKMQKNEVSGLVEISIDEGLKLCAGEVSSVKCKVIRAIDGKTVSSMESIKFEHFIPRIDSYYYKVFIMAERLLQSNHYISI